MSIIASLLDSSVPKYFPPENCSPDDVQTFTSRMKLQYQYQAIIKSGDSVTPGNLVLIERKVDIEHKKMSDYLLAGQVDEVLKMPGINSVNLSDVLQSKQPVVVVLDGPPGIGKTTLCRKLLNMWSNGEIKYELVLYCPLRNSQFAEAKDLADLFLFDLSKVFKVLDLFKKRNGEGLLIIFDGWDASSMRSSLVASIIHRKELGKCSVLITSRSCSSSAISSINRHVQVIGFSSEEMLRVIIQTIYHDSKLAQEFIDKKKECDKNGKPFRPDLKNSDTALAFQIINDHNVLSLCYIPLVCFAVIESYKHRSTRLTDLYDSIISRVINDHKQSKHAWSFFSLQISAPLQKLCQIAFDNLSNTRITLSEQSLDYFGLMTVDVEKKYRFLHSNIQQFLAAWWITHKHEETQKVFMELFNSGNFQMCLRFMAGLTRVQDMSKGSILDESYKQYFNAQQLDFQCQRKQLFGLKMDHYSPFYSRNRDHIYMDCISASKFSTLIIQLLYESKNGRLCKELAQSMKNKSLCLNGTSLSLYDWLCLYYFQIKWQDLHLGTLYAQTLTLLEEKIYDLPCRVLEGKLLEPMTDDIQALCYLIHKTQECYVTLEGGHYIPSDILLQFFSSGLKVLHLTLNNLTVLSYDSSNSTIPQFEERIQENSVLEEVNLKFNGQLGMDIIVSIIRGVLKNQQMKSFSLAVTSLDHPIPADIIENLFKHNVTLQDLSLNIPDELLPSSLNIVEVNTPLTALEMSSKKLVTSILPHITGLCYLILHEPYTPHLIFESNPSLQTLSFPLNAAESAIELFNILQDNTTLKSLRVEMDEIFDDNAKLFTSLEAMLKQNQTLQSFELTSEGSVYNYVPFSFFSSLIAGITSNSSTNIEDLSVPIPLSKRNFKIFEDFISRKVTLKKCHIDFRPDESYQLSSDERKKEIMILLYEKLADVITMMPATSHFRLLGQETDDFKTQNSTTYVDCGELFSEDTLKDFKRALEEGTLTYSVSTAFIQGEARVGKTCLKSLILSLPYDEVSTSCIEAPCIAFGNFSVDHYGHTDGKGWKLVTDGEMDDKIIAELQEYVALGNIPASEDDDVHQHTTIMEVQENPMVVSSVNDPPMEIELQKVSPDTLTIITDTTDMDDSQITDLKQEHETQQDQISLASALELGMPASVHQEDDILEYCKRECHIDKFGYHRKWLYFIDSGGQIQFQKLLLAFLPCTSVFILVINLSKNLSDFSSTEMQLRNDQIAVDEHSLSVKDMLKQMLSAVASNAQQYKLVIQDSECIKHSGKKLSVITVGTYRDKYEELRQNNRDIEEIVAKQMSLESILDSVQNICDIVHASSPSLSFGQPNLIHEIDGRKAVDGRYDDVELDHIIQSLENQSYEVTVPLRWHYFGLVLRNKAKKSEGVLMKSSCDEYGAMLGMESSEVHSALQFFHTLKMLFYYHDSPAKDIVFVKLNSLINIIRELMITVCKARSEEIRPKNLKKLAAKSYLSMKNLESCESFDKIANFVKSIDLLGLFEHLKIAAKLPKGEFLMPALLPVRDVSDPQFLPCTIPLLFYFRTTAVPMGLYCAVIVYLLSDSKSNWCITSRDDCCSNYFTLQRIPNLFADGWSLNVALVEQLNCIEVYCDGKDERQTVREEIRKSIDEVMKEKLIDYETPEEVFYCPCTPKRDHIAKVVNKAFIICEDKNDTQEFADSKKCEEYWSWTMNKEEIEEMNKQRMNFQPINKRKTQCE